MASPISLSVIMANRNGADHLRDALASVLAQTHRNLELILSDDASTDDSIQIAQGMSESDRRLRILTSDVATGPAATRNRAIATARGDWIAIVDSDDLIHPARFKRMLHEVANLGVDILADDQVYFGAQFGHTLLEGRDFHEPWHLSARDYLAAEMSSPPVPVGYLKPVIRRSALGDLRYNETMTIGEDFDLLFRLLLGGSSLAVLPEAYYLYRRHSNSTSYRLSPDDCSGLVRACEGYLNIMPEDLVPLVRRRLQMHQANRAYAELVSRLKSGSVAGAAAMLARHPSLIGALARSLAERSAQSTAGRSAEPAEPAIDLFQETVEDPCDEFLPHVLPDKESGWTPAMAAALIAKAGHGNARLRARGHAGLHALGYVPGWKSAELLPPEEGWTDRDRERIAAFPWPVAIQ